MPRPETVNNKFRRRHQPGFDEKIADRKERHELQDVEATIASLEKQLAELQLQEQEKQLLPVAGSDKEQLKALQKQLKEERKKVAELEAEIAEQVVARERAEADLAKLESTAKLVEEKQAELKQAQDDLRSKEAELEDINCKIVIIEGTLERLRMRHASDGGEEQSVQEKGDKMQASSVGLLSQTLPDISSTKAPERSFKMTEDLEAMEEELAQVQARIEEERIKADEFERELMSIQAECEPQEASEPSPNPHPQPFLSQDTTGHSAFVAERLLKIITESNKTVNTLREENMSLLMQIAGVSASA